MILTLFKTFEVIIANFNFKRDLKENENTSYLKCNQSSFAEAVGYIPSSSQIEKSPENTIS